MKKGICLLIVILNVTLCFSQNISDSILIKQRLGKVYLQKGVALNSSKLHAILESNENAAVDVKKAKANLAPMYLFSCSGGFMIGWPLGTALGGGKPQWWMAAAGVGLVLCAIPFQTGYNKHIFNAVTIYNSDLKKIGISRKLMEVGFAKNGLGIAITF